MESYCNQGVSTHRETCKKNMEGSKMLSVDGILGRKMVSNKLGEPVALFAVSLPSACKSDFLCLCKRLFWNVGTSYFSAFCPLTTEETRTLPHSSSVVQLVSVTPAVEPGDESEKRLTQDLLAYTLWGDIVGVPYVAITKDRQTKGKLSKAFPFDDLTSSAWVPAMNAPFVGATAGSNNGQGGPMKDVFIIRNDAKTRQSLLKGGNVIFSQQDGQSCTAKVCEESIAIPAQQQPVKDRDLHSKMSPTSSSLYKSYNLNKRYPENVVLSTPSSYGMSGTITSSPVMEEKCNDYPAMVLPRIESVFSLAGSSSHGGLPKLIADTLAQRSASLQRKLPTSKSMVTNSATSAPPAPPDKDNTLKESVSIDSNTEKLKVSSQTIIKGKTEMDSTLTKRLQGLTSPWSAPPHPFRPVQECSSSETKRQPAKSNLSTVRQGVGVKKLKRLPKTSRLTVKELLQKSGQMTICPVSGGLLPASQNPFGKDDSMTPHSFGQQSSNASDKIPVDSIQKSKCTGIYTSLKMVIKTKRESADKVKTSCHPINDTLVVMDGRVPCLKLKKLDISCYKFVDATAMCDGCSTHLDEFRSDSLICEDGVPNGTECANEAVSESNDPKKLITKSTFGGDNRNINTPNVSIKADGIGMASRLSRNSLHEAQSEPTSTHKDSRPNKRKRRKLRCSEPQRSSSKLDNVVSKTNTADTKWDARWIEDRERLSDCQNKLAERSKRRKVGNASIFDFDDSGNHFDVEGVTHVPSSNPCRRYAKSTGDTKNHTGGSGKDLEESALNLALEISQEDEWSNASDSTDSDWECPEGKSGDPDSDWDSSLEDEASGSPRKSIQPIKKTPFGDFHHMVLKDRLRLLEETIKEHQMVLNEIHNTPQDTSR